MTKYVAPSQKIKLYNTNALDFLSEDKTVEAGSASLILTDPPYVISKETGFTKKDKNGEFGGIASYAVKTEFGDWDTDEFTMEQLSQIVHAMPLTLKPGGAAVIFFDLWKMTTLKKMMTSAGFTGIKMIQWRKTNAVPINSRSNYLTNSREVALYGYLPNGVPTLNNPDPLGTYSDSIYASKDRFHTTQKSVRVFDKIIAEYSNPNDLVLDCFSGSATTAISAHNTNRLFKGCELDEKYFKKSSDRIEKLFSQTSKNK